MTRHLKLFAAVLVVLVSISGFSPARSSSGGKSRSSSGGSSGGGGCSSKKSSSHSYRHDDDDDDYGSSSGGTNSRPTPTRSPSAVAVTCAGDGRTGAEYEVRNRNSRTKTYTLEVDFLDKAGELVDEGSETVSVSGSGSTTAKVPMEHPERAGKVAYCEVDSLY